MSEKDDQTAKSQPDHPAPTASEAAEQKADAPAKDKPAPATEKKPDTPAKDKPAPAAKKKADAPAQDKPASAAEKKPDAPAKGPKVALVVDDEPANRDFLVRLLEQAQMVVTGASEGEEALQIADRFEAIHLLAIDHKLPDMDGVELVAKMRERFPDAYIVVATMLDDRSLMAKAFDNGCNVFLVKPHGFMELFQRLQGGIPEDTSQQFVIDQYGLRPFRG